MLLRCTQPADIDARGCAGRHHRRRTATSGYAGGTCSIIAKKPSYPTIQLLGESRGNPRHRHQRQQPRAVAGRLEKGVKAIFSTQIMIGPSLGRDCCFCKADFVMARFSAAPVRPFEPGLIAQTGHQGQEGGSVCRSRLAPCPCLPSLCPARVPGHPRSSGGRAPCAPLKAFLIAAPSGLWGKPV